MYSSSDRGIFFWIDNQRNIINENIKEKYKLFMMMKMNNRKMIKQTTKKREIRKLILEKT